MWCEGRNTSFTCSKGWHQLTSRVHSSFRFMLPILLSHCEYLRRLWLLDVRSDSSATNNNISPTLHVDMQRRSDITLVNLGNMTFRSLHVWAYVSSSAYCMRFVRQSGWEQLLFITIDWSQASFGQLYNLILSAHHLVQPPLVAYVLLGEFHRVGRLYVGIARTRNIC